MTRPGVEVRGRKSGMKSHQQTVGDSVEWYTPPGIFAALGLEFELDVAAPPGGLSWIPARRFYCAADDGLLQPWDGHVWMNPPYGRGIELWMRKMAAHGDGVALVPANTETQWWQRTVPNGASAVCFVDGRLTFLDAEQRPGKFNGGGGSALIGYGDVCGDAVAAAGLGWTVRQRPAGLDGQVGLWEA